MLKNLFRKRRFAGLDAGSGSVKAIELSGKGDSLTLTGMGIEPLAPDTIFDSQIIDREEMAKAISKLFSKNHLDSQHLTTGIGGYPVILKNIEAPPMSEEEWRECAEWHAEEHVPYELSDVRLGYQIIASNSDSLSVLLAACKKEPVENLEQTIKLAGMKADIIDLNALALQNCYTFNYQPSDDSLVALLHIGASSMIIHIVKGRHCKFMRDVSVGGNNYTEQIQRELGLTFAQAEAAKLGGKRDLEIEETEIREVAEAIAQRVTFETEVERVIETISEMFEVELRKTLDFYRATAPDGEETIQKILISGGGSKLKGLIERLARSVDIPIEPLDPFRRIKFNERRFSEARLREAAPLMAVAVGLALRGSNAPLIAINLAEGATENKLAALSVKETGKRWRKETNKIYLYKGRNRLGEILIGERAAKNVESLRALLRREQIVLTSVQEEAPELFSFAFGWRRKKVSLSELENFTRRFSLMLNMGSPILPSLQALALESKNKYFAQTLGEIISDMEQGSTLYAAMELHPDVFDDYFVNLFQAGEVCAMYDTVLPRLLVDLERRLEWRQSIKLAVFYPASLLAVAFVTMLLTIITALGRVPGRGFLTRGFAATEVFLSVVGGVIILAAIVVAVLWFGIFNKSQQRRRQIDATLLRIPFVGPLMHKYALARFARIMSTLLSSGVPYMTAFDVTIKDGGNSIFLEAIEAIKSAVYRGQSFTAAMNEVFPETVKQTMGVGEAMGGLDYALAKVADIYELEVSRAISRLPFVTVSLTILLLVLIAVGLRLIQSL